MAKGLFLSLPLHGHTNPTLTLVKELVRRGEEIVYYSTPAFREKIEQVGAAYRPYQNAFLAEMKNLPEQTHQLAWLLMRTTAEVLEQELEEFRTIGPEYIITDAVAPWGQWVAKILGLPTITSMCTFAVNRQVLAYGFSHGVRPKSSRLFLSKIKHVGKALSLKKRLESRYHVGGLDMKSMMFGSSDLNIVYTSRYFQPCADSFDDSYLFMGPSIAERIENTPFPWERIEQRALVYVSMGTLFNTDAKFYRECFDAFRDEDFQVVLSTGASVAPDSLGPAPANFIVQPHIPQLKILQMAAAFVTHGGMNSVNESFNFGVPVLAIPQMGEQEIVGRRVEQLGAGMFLKKEQATAERLREKVRRLLADGTYRRQTDLLRESFQNAGGIGRAADAVLAFTQ